ASGPGATAPPATRPPGPPTRPAPARARPGRRAAAAREVRPVDDASIGRVGLGLSLILVGAAVALVLSQGLRSEREVQWATGRLRRGRGRDAGPRRRGR